MRGRWKHLNAAGRVAVTVASLAVAAVIVLGIRSTGLVTSQGGGEGSAVNFAKTTPLPFQPVTYTPPDYSNPSHCQAAEDERPSPDLPPLSCRNSAGEPPPSFIPTVDPAVAPLAARARAGWKIVDNRLFRMTVQVPDSWYSNMRPEGGTFAVADPAATAHAAGRSPTSGLGIAMLFEAHAPSGVVPEVSHKLEQPNATFAGVPGVIWDEGNAEGSRYLRAAFRVGDVTYQMDIYVDGSPGRPTADIEADIELVKAILATVTTY